MIVPPSKPPTTSSAPLEPGPSTGCFEEEARSSLSLSLTCGGLPGGGTPQSSATTTPDNRSARATRSIPGRIFIGPFQAGESRTVAQQGALRELYGCLGPRYRYAVRGRKCISEIHPLLAGLCAGLDQGRLSKRWLL